MAVVNNKKEYAQKTVIEDRNGDGSKAVTDMKKGNMQRRYSTVIKKKKNWRNIRRLPG